MAQRQQGLRRLSTRRDVAWVCALIMALLMAPLGCKPSGGAPAAGGVVSVPATAQQADAVLDSVARYLPANTFAVASVDLSLMGSGYSALFSQGLGMTQAEYNAMLKEVNDFILARMGWTVTDVRWAFVGVSESKEIVLLVHADAQIQRGLEPIPGSAGLKGLRFEDVVIVPLAEQGLYAVLFDPKSVSWFAERKSTLDSAEGKPRLALLNGLLQKGAKHSIISAAISLEGDAKPIKNLRRDMPPPLQRVKGASMSVGDAMMLVMHADNADLQAINDLIEVLVAKGEGELKSVYAKIEQLDTAEGLAVIAASHLLNPIVRTFTPKIEGDFSFIRIEGDSSSPMAALASIWVIGVLAAVAVPAFMGYVKKSKSSEGTLNLKAIGDGALSFSMQIRADGSIGYPIVPQRVCTSTGGSINSQQVPNAADYRQSPWSDLRFSVNRPHFYRYCYESAPDGSSFKATAILDDDTSLQLNGAIDRSSGRNEPILGSVEDFYP